MYVYYPNGGYYRRHCDSENSSECISNVREWSFILYLNPDWCQRQGGCLRIHQDSHDAEPSDGTRLPNYFDIEPKSGTLVLFRSKAVPHEVLVNRLDSII